MRRGLKDSGPRHDKIDTGKWEERGEKDRSIIIAIIKPLCVLGGGSLRKRLPFHKSQSKEENSISVFSLFRAETRGEKSKRRVVII